MYNSTYSTDKLPQVIQAKKFIYFYMYETHTIEGQCKQTIWFDTIRIYKFRQLTPKNINLTSEDMQKTYVQVDDYFKLLRAYLHWPRYSQWYGSRYRSEGNCTAANK